MKKEGLVFYLLMNAYWEALEFELPATNGKPWRRWIDTALPSPDDIVPWQTGPTVAGPTYPSGPRSVVMLYRAV